MSASAMLVRVFSLRFNPPEAPLQFWVPYIVFILASAFIVLTRKNYTPLYAIIGMTILLNLISGIRSPSGFIWSVDPPYHLQIASRIVDTGELIFGYAGFTGQAYSFSFYPGLEILLSSLRMVTGIPLMILYKFSFMFINITTLLLLYYSMRSILGNSKIVNVCVFLYALCPMFHGFNSASVSESFGIIFYPFLLFSFINACRPTRINYGESTANRVYARKAWLLFMIFMGAVTITHHWTMYMLIFHAFVIVSGTFILAKKGSISTSLNAQVNKLALSIICTAGWLLFVATTLLILHTNILSSIIQSLIQSFSGAGEARIVPYAGLGFFEKTFSYMGIGMLLLLSLLGAYVVYRGELKNRLRKTEMYSLMFLWVFDIFLMGVFEVINWQSSGLIEGADIRYRALEFYYFGFVLFSAFGLTYISKKLGFNDFKNKLNRRFSVVVSAFLLLLISIPAITIGFPYYYYDNPLLKSSDGDNAYPREAYHFSIWLRTQNVSGVIASTYRESGYIGAYAQKEYNYTLFVESVQQRKMLAKFYVVNKAGLAAPDSFNFRLHIDDLIWITNESHKFYDNGAITAYLDGKPDKQK